MPNFARGKFYPKNPQKYVGNKVPTYRSSWEMSFMGFCDQNPHIVQWASESIKIPYLDPIDGRRRKYIPDFLIQYHDKNGKAHTELIEIKPKKQTTLKEAGRSKKAQEAVILNEAKWKSAVAFCDRMGIIFRILTEDDLFLNGKKRK